MAYMGRGGFSSFGGGTESNNNQNNNNGNNSNRNDRRMYTRDGMFRRNYYIPLDNTYVIFQMIATIIIFATAGVAFLTTYKPSVIDPIENTKRIFMNTYIIITLILLALTLLVNYFSKDKNALIKRLIAILSLSLITILVFLGIKANINSTYTKNKFEEIYEQKYGGKSSDTKPKIDIGLTGIKIKSEKEYYVDECVKAYTIFSVRMYSVIGINILLIILLMYQIYKASRIQEIRDKLSKDDAILLNEEENVKF